MADDESREGLAKAAEAAVPIVEQIQRDAGGPIIPRKGHRPIEIQTDDEGVYLVNTDHGGHIQEWGSVKSAPYAVLRRGAQAAGLRVDET
jgi:hypothetical protein